MPSSPRTRTGMAVAHNNAASPIAARRESLKLIIGNPGLTERLKDERILTDARLSGEVRAQVCNGKLLACAAPRKLTVCVRSLSGARYQVLHWIDRLVVDSHFI